MWADPITPTYHRVPRNAARETAFSVHRAGALPAGPSDAGEPVITLVLLKAAWIFVGDLDRLQDLAGYLKPSLVGIQSRSGAPQCGTSSFSSKSRRDASQGPHTAFERLKPIPLECEAVGGKVALYTGCGADGAGITSKGHIMSQKRIPGLPIVACALAALAAIRRAVRSWSKHRRSDKTLDDLARLFNSSIRGWINYYGRFCPSALYPTLQRIDLTLARWASGKFKSLRGHKRRSRHWLARIARQQPRLFAHWDLLYGSGRTMGAG